VRLKKHGPLELRLNGEHSRVEALKVARLQDAVAYVGDADQVVCFSEGCGQRFFNQQIDTGLEQLSGNSMMMDRRNGHRRCIQAQIGSQQLGRRRIDGNLILGGGFGGARGVRLDARDQGDAEPGVLKLAVNTEMIAAKGAGAGNSNAQSGRAGYFPTPLPSTAWRQRV
jgi:hypothetical protein